jgi:hypothetical protein
VPVQAVWFCHWLLTQACTVLPLAAHCVPDVHSTQLLFAQKGIAPEQAWPHVPQLAALLLGSVHAMLQSIGAVAGQPELQAYPPGADAEGAHSGVPSEHVTPHAPQLGLTDRSVAQPAPASPQSAWPAAHWYEQWPPLHARPAALMFCSCVQSFPQAPQFRKSVLVLPHPASTSAVASEGALPGASDIVSPGASDVASLVASPVTSDVASVSAPGRVESSVGSEVASPEPVSTVVRSAEASGPRASSPGSCVGSVPTHTPPTHR